ncbi:hypothetical protein [Flavobacterium defluvii]|uniref:Tetratricopeptide repeat-containing protein n=1 Tax=Flavobacterium defluvii TaxID=370979 RepID=A0A1M5SU65_9FLAO|nr:hypothetical protein [Flavobacterium defluvii]SHH42007.1 hypothetical protein SAMN05443663_107220 [Flavobacterium defluvii]
MKNFLILIIFFCSVTTKSQNADKEKFQKNKYELAVSYLKKSNYIKALEQFSIASKIKPETEIAINSLQEIDTLKDILRKEILEKISGTWIMTGNKPIWTVDSHKEFKEKNNDELIEVNQDKILFYKQDRKSKIKTLIKTEDLVYFNNDRADDLYSAIILSDGKIWDYYLDENNTVLRAINIAKKGRKGVEKIETNNKEVYYTKAK